MISSKTDMVHELPHQFPNNLKLRIQGNQEILEKSQIRMTAFSQPFSFQKSNFDNRILKKRKSRYHFLVLSDFTGFLYFVPNILSRIVYIFQNSNKSLKCKLSISEKYSNLGQSKTNSKIFFIVTKSLNLEKFQNFLNINP